MIPGKIRSCKDAVVITVKDFMLNTTLHGYRHLAEIDRHWFERIIWVAAEIIAAYAVVFSIMDIYSEYLNTPTVTTIESTQFPIWNVPLPSIGICNINKVSKKKARALAKDLMEHNPQYTEEQLFQLLRYFGRIYDQNVKGSEKVKELHEILKARWPSYDAFTLQKQLAPDCEDMILSCMWKGRKVDCNEMFGLLNTIVGFCCVFNYIRPLDDIDGEKHRRAERLTSPGYKMGLNLVVDPHYEDYFYPTIPTYGTQLILFDPKDHPDSPSGLLEKIVPLNTEIFFTLSAESRYSVSDLKMVDPLTRRCFFDEETTNIIPGLYAYGRCLGRCGAGVIFRMCGCVPFYFEDPNTTKICDLSHIPCLMRNKENFENPENSTGIKVEFSNVKSGIDISCDECLPSCSDTRYEILSSSGRIGLPSSHRSKLLEGINLNYNHSIIHLYYSNIDTTLYKQDILFSWYELVSNFGGICSLYNGFSFISVIEILYFFSLRFFYVSRREDEPDSTMVNSTKSFAQKMESDPKPKPVYWNELGGRY